MNASTLPWVVTTFVNGGWHSILVTKMEDIPVGASFTVAATNIETEWPKGKTEAYHLDPHYIVGGKT